MSIVCRGSDLQFTIILSNTNRFTKATEQLSRSSSLHPRSGAARPAYNNNDAPQRQGQMIQHSDENMGKE